MKNIKSYIIGLYVKKIFNARFPTTTKKYKEVQRTQQINADDSY